MLIVLLALPLAVGAITNTAASDEDRNWTPSYAPDTSGASFYSIWVNNGEDFSNHYTNTLGPTYGNCSYIAAPFPNSLSGSCLGSSGVSGGSVFDIFGNDVSNTVLGIPAIEMPVSHNSIPSGDYLGTSGQGPFSWTFTPNVNQIPDGELPEAFRWTFVQPSTSYSCSHSTFVDLLYDLEVRWLAYDPISGDVEEVLKIRDDQVEGSNKLQLETYYGGHWNVGCYVGMNVQIDLTGYEQVALNTEAAEYNWSNIYVQLTIDDLALTNTTGQNNIGQTLLPWNGDQGDGEFLIVQEYSTRNEAEVNFFIRGGTLILSIAVMLIGVGSTPYWDPLRAWFRGRI